MKTRIRRVDLWPCILLTVALWTALAVTRWLAGPALPDLAVALLAVVGFVPAYLGLLVSFLKLAARRAETVDDGTDAGVVEASAACWSRPNLWSSGIPVTASGAKAPETGPASGTGPDKRPVEAGQGLWPVGARASRPARFLCGTCRVKREMDDLAVTDDRGASMCVACHAREGGFYRPVPASLVQAVRAVLEGTAEL